MAEVVTVSFRCLRLWLALALFPSAAFAHVLDEYLQATLVTIRGDEIRLQMNLTPGTAVADQVIGLIDRNRDGAISTNEVAAYAESLRRDLSVRLDGQPVELKVAAVNFPEVSELRTGWGILQIELSGKVGSIANGVHRVVIENRHLPGVSVYLINAAQPETPAIQILAQKRNPTQSEGEVDFRMQGQGGLLGAFGIAALGGLGVVFVVGMVRAARKPSTVRFAPPPPGC